MEVLIDTNIILDVGLKRAPLDVSSAEVMKLCQSNHRGWVAWHTVSNVFYLMRQQTKSWADAATFVKKLLSWAWVARTGNTEMQRATAMELRDLEDAMQIAAAEACAADAIITRNTKDFATSPVPIFTPEEFLAKFHPVPTPPP